jgi:hypothetical protein
MKKLNLTKDQLQKVGLSSIGFVVLLYVYFSFFLGPLNKSRDSMKATINDLQDKIGSSKDEMAKAANLERQARAATTRFAALKALSPEGAPIAWFPPRMKAFFVRQQIDKATARLENSNPFKDAELADWTQYNWLLDVPQADFATLGGAIAELENAEPLLSIHHLNIRSVPDAPQFQQVSLNVATAMPKR